MVFVILKDFDESVKLRTLSKHTNIANVNFPSYYVVSLLSSSGLHNLYFGLSTRITFDQRPRNATFNLCSGLRRVDDWSLAVEVVHELPRL